MNRRSTMFMALQSCSVIEALHSKSCLGCFDLVLLSSVFRSVDECSIDSVAQGEHVVATFQPRSQVAACMVDAQAV